MNPESLRCTGIDLFSQHASLATFARSTQEAFSHVLSSAVPKLCLSVADPINAPTSIARRLPRVLADTEFPEFTRKQIKEYEVCFKK